MTDETTQTTQFERSMTAQREDGLSLLDMIALTEAALSNGLPEDAKLFGAGPLGVSVIRRASFRGVVESARDED